MGSRQVAVYFAWSRPDEENAQLGTLENRFTALFEARRIQWPRQEHLGDPAKFDQGIAGFLDHILLANFAMFADFASSLTGNSVRIAQRQTRAAHTALSSQWLVGVDTLIIISWDSNRSKQQATPEELQAVRALLDKPGSTVFICPHHDVGDVRDLSADEGFRSREAEFHHHGDPAIPSQQRFGMFGRSLLDGLGLPIRNRFGLRPARTADGSPAPLKKDASVDRLDLLNGVPTFNLHPHLPHFEMLRESASRFDVLARQPIDLNAPPHPFVERGRDDFDALLQTRQNIFPGQLLISDTTLWMSAAEGLDSLQQFWRNVLQLPVR